jgi:hypothetical protein
MVRPFSLGFDSLPLELFQVVLVALQAPLVVTLGLVPQVSFGSVQQGVHDRQELLLQTVPIVVAPLFGWQVTPRLS